MIRLFLVLLVLLSPFAHSQVPSKRGEVAENWDEAYKRLKPVKPASRLGGDRIEMTGKVLTGYQGWFAAEGDGSGIGWQHYGGKNLGPGHCTFDLWPDLGELTQEEKYPSPFRMEDGSVAPLFSSYNPLTVDRHFKWMADYGIDAAMLQRFGVGLRHPRSFDFNTAVMENVRKGADHHGRAWAVMYDLSGLKEGEAYSVVSEDWKRLVDRAQVLKDHGYLHHHGKPLVAVWGVGFNDGRAYTLEECGRLVDFLKNDPKYGGNAVMLGVPYYWREQRNDADTDPALHAILKKADVVSPWSIGRYGSIETVAKNLPKQLAADSEWCESNGLTYLPVAFPGFSWQNLMKTRGNESKLNSIPREGGDFLWRQALEIARVKAPAVYLAMFDEIDEGTALMKASNHPPVGESNFITLEGKPEDHYLWLSGQIGKMLRGEIPQSEEQPAR